MAILEILHYPDKRLQNKAQPVTTITPALLKLADDMLETMYHHHGIGLSATQVNRDQRVVVIDLSEECNQPMFLFNPEIDQCEGQVKFREGCLSVPGFFDLVERAEHIDYHYLDRSGSLQRAQASGLLAVCIQHEIDHLNGRLFVDYLSMLKRNRIKEKIAKQEHASNLA